MKIITLTIPEWDGYSKWFEELKLNVCSGRPETCSDEGEKSSWKCLRRFFFHSSCFSVLGVRKHYFSDFLKMRKFEIIFARSSDTLLPRLRWKFNGREKLNSGNSPTKLKIAIHFECLCVCLRILRSFLRILKVSQKIWNFVMKKGERIILKIGVEFYGNLIFIKLRCFSKSD